MGEAKGEDMIFDLNLVGRGKPLRKLCTPLVTLDFILHKEQVIFREIPKNNHFIHFQGFSLSSQRISLTFGWKQMFCCGIYCWYQSVFIFSIGWCDTYQGSSVCSLPLWVEIENQDQCHRAPLPEIYVMRLLLYS